MEEGTLRRSGPWPLVAVGLLLLMLSAFLYLRLERGGRSAPVVKADRAVESPPPGAPESAEPPPAPPEADPPPPPCREAPEPQDQRPDQGSEELGKLLDAARGAVAEKRWDEALKALESARAIRDDPAIGPIHEAVSVGRREEAEARRRFEAAFSELREKVENLKLQNLYDAAAAELERFEKEHPRAGSDEPFRRLIGEVAEFRRDADAAFLRSMGEARRGLEEGRFPQALAFSERAAKLYPERRDEVGRFQEQVNARMLQEKMVRIPAGDYWIGSDDDLYPDERPFQKVRLPVFYIDKYETTNEEYYAFTMATGHPPPPSWPKDGKPPKGRERHPVVLVTWEDAAKYAAWAGKRLPTAEEWEAAARGPGPAPYVFPWGNSFTEKENEFLCNCYEYWQINRLAGTTTPVDQPPNAPSPFGVYGMGGNVWEWTSTAVRRKVGGREAEFRIIKGGSFMTYRRAVRASNICAEDPALPRWDVGFRCARDSR